MARGDRAVLRARRAASEAAAIRACCAIRAPARCTLRSTAETSDEELKDALDAQCRQELERLLYVALTRAKHTLVLVDDHALFSGKSGLPKYAPARLLIVATTPRIRRAPGFAGALRDDPRAADGDNGATRRSSIPSGRRSPFPRDAATAACARATLFIKRNPSALAEAALADADPAAYLEARAPHRGHAKRRRALRHVVARIRRAPRLAAAIAGDGMPVSKRRSLTRPTRSFPSGMGAAS